MVPIEGVKNLDNLTVVVLFNIEVSASSIVLETDDALYLDVNVCKLFVLSLIV